MRFSRLAMLVWLIVYLIKDVKATRKFNRETFPNNLVELVQQAHAGLPFNTVSNISVSADMRQKLCYPLTPELVEVIKATSYYNCQWKKFSYKLAEYENKEGLSGTVLVTIRFQDNSKNINLDYEDVPIYIECRPKSVKSGRGLEVTKVEYPGKA